MSELSNDSSRPVVLDYGPSESRARRIWRRLPKPSIRSIALIASFAAALCWLGMDHAPWKVVAVIHSQAWGDNVANYSRDGTRFVTAGADGIVRIWDTYTGKLQHVLTGAKPGKQLIAVALSTDGTRAAALSETDADYRDLHWWDTISGSSGPLAGGFCRANWLEFPAGFDGVLTIGYGPVAQLWQIPGGGVRSCDAPPDGAMLFARYGYALSHDGRLLATLDDRQIGIFDLQTGACLHRLAVSPYRRWGLTYFPSPDAAAFSPDDRFLFATCWWTARLWDVKTGEQRYSVPCNGGGFRSVSFSPDGTRVAAIGDWNSDQVWDARTGNALFALSPRFELGRAVSWSADGSELIASSAGNGVTLLCAATDGRLIGTLRMPGVWFSQFKVSPDGRHVLAWDDNGTACLFVKRRPEQSYGVAFLPQFCAAAVAGAAVLWSLRRDRRKSARWIAGTAAMTP